MTISTTTARVAYTGDGSTTAFAVPFYFLANADLDVYQAGTLKTITTHYTVTGAGVEAGGTVTFGTAPALDESVVIVRDTALTQATDYPPNDPFPAASHERALDKLTMIAQRNRDLIDRSFRLPDDDVSGASTELPAPESLGVIGWNADADALVNYDAASLAGAVAAVDWIVDTFDGTGAQTAFTLTRNPGVAANCDVSISGVTQVPGVDFTVSSTTLTFTAAPASGTGNVCVRYGSSLPSAAVVPAGGVATASIQDGAVTTVKIADDNVTVAKIADVELKALAGLTSAANKVPMFSGSGTATLLDFKDEDDMASDSATAVPSQQSVKAYVDTEVAAVATTKFTSSDQVITSAGALVLAHSLGSAPFCVQTYLVCQSDEAGYTTGDVVLYGDGRNDAGSGANGSHAIKVDATNITVRFGSAVAVYSIPHSTTGVGTSLSNTNWKLRVKALV